MQIDDSDFIKSVVQLDGVHIVLFDTSNFDIRPPLIIIPGLLSNPQQFIELGRMFHPRRVIILGRRAAGSYDVSSGDFSVESQVSDVSKSIALLKVKSFYVLAHSMGVPIAVAATTQQSGITALGLILVDYAAEYYRLSPRWLESVVSRRPEIPTDTLAQIVETSGSYSAWEQLKMCSGAVLLIRGGESNFVSDEQIAMYRQHVSDFKFLTVKGVGHDVWKNEEATFARIVNAFLSTIDSNTTT